MSLKRTGGRSRLPTLKAHAGDPLLPYPTTPHSFKTAPQLGSKFLNLCTDGDVFHSNRNRALTSELATFKKEVCDVICLCSRWWETGGQSQQITGCALYRGHPQRVFSFSSISSFQVGMGQELEFCSWSILCFQKPILPSSFSLAKIKQQK